MIAATPLITRTTAQVVRISLVWTLLYGLVRKMLPDRSLDFCNRVVSFIHAVVAVALCIWAADWADPMARIAEKTTPEEASAVGWIWFRLTVAC